MGCGMMMECNSGDIPRYQIMRGESDLDPAYVLKAMIHFSREGTTIDCEDKDSEMTGTTYNYDLLAQESKCPGIRYTSFIMLLVELR
jgi:hypothetical protein